MKSGWLTSLLLLLCTGCASFSGLRPLTYATPGEARVFATGESCVHDPAGEEAAFLVAALTGVASQLLKNFGTALSEGAKGGALPSAVATRNLQLDPGAAPKCLVVIRGSFRRTEGEPKVSMPAFLGLAAGDAEKRKRLESLNLPAIYRVDHYVELRLRAPKNNKALTFAPVFVKLAQSIDGDSSGQRALSISVKFNRPGVDAVGSAVALADLGIGKTFAQEVGESGRYEVEAPWFGSFHEAPKPVGIAASGPGGQTPKAPPPVAPTATGGGPVSPPPVNKPQSGVATMQSDSADAVPITVTITVVETRPTREGLAFIASVFNGLEPKIEDALKPIIDPNARRAAENTDASTSLGALGDYASADGTARAALLAYCRASSTATDQGGLQDRIKKSTDARTAQLKANVAAIKAQLAQPYSDLITISADMPASDNNAVCTKYG